MLSTSLTEPPAAQPSVPQATHGISPVHGRRQRRGHCRISRCDVSSCPFPTVCVDTVGDALAESGDREKTEGEVPRVWTATFRGRRSSTRYDLELDFEPGRCQRGSWAYAARVPFERPRSDRSGRR